VKSSREFGARCRHAFDDCDDYDGSDDYGDCDTRMRIPGASLERGTVRFAMSQPPDMANPLDPLGIWRQSQDAMFDTWSKAMVDMVNTEAYAETTGRMLDAYLTLLAPVRKAMEQTMPPLLAQLNLPSRAEVVSLAERMTNIEMRLDDLDARLDAIQRAVERTADAVASLGAPGPSTARARSTPTKTTAKTTTSPGRRTPRTSSPAATRRPSTQRPATRRPSTRRSPTS